MHRRTKMDVIVFGVGEIFNVLKTYLYENYNIVAFMDNDMKKQYTTIDNITIINPKDLFSYKFEKIIVTVTGHQKYVVKQLLELGIAKENIILGVNFLMLNDEGNKYEYFIDENLDISFRYSTSKSAILPIEKNDITYLTFSKDAVITPSLVRNGEFSQKELDTFFILAKKLFGKAKGTFLDVGANIGTTSLMAAKNHQISEVIAIEASSDNYALLQSNIYLNKLQKKIQALNVAASDSNGTVNLLISPVLSSDNRVRVSESFRADLLVEKVDSIMIDDLINDFENSMVFMWVDVQGYEYYVLKGAKNIISNRQVAVQIEFWPLGLYETNTLEQLCQFCKENFSSYIDIKEQLQGIEIIHDINEIDFLAKKYQETHTDLFLIPLTHSVQLT